MKYFYLLLMVLLGVCAGCTNQQAPPVVPVIVEANPDEVDDQSKLAPSSSANDGPSTIALSSPDAVRFATYNVAMNREIAGGLVTSLGDGGLLAGKRVAEIVQRVRPQVLLLNEVDYDEDQTAVDALRTKYFAVGQNGQSPIEYPYVYTAAVNTGEPSGMDLDQDGKSDGPGDGFGYGAFPGQYGMVVLSQFPISTESVRSLRTFLWKDMPNAAAPIDPESKKPFYPDDVWAKLRLSSKSHWDVPVDINGKTVHFLVCHPTPPVFDGPEDRNGKRNHDEIRMWADYVDPERSAYLYDENGTKGGLAAGDQFVIAGDLNADPNDGDSADDAVQQLLEHPLVHADPKPAGTGGGVAKAKKDGRANAKHTGDANLDTGDFPDKYSGNLRIDYVLPSKTMSCVGSGVFWPAPGEDGAELVRASDHRLVWIDVELP